MGIWDISEYHTESLRLLRRGRGRELGHTMLQTGDGMFLGSVTASSSYQRAEKLNLRSIMR